VLLGRRRHGEQRAGHDKEEGTNGTHRGVLDPFSGGNPRIGKKLLFQIKKGAAKGVIVGWPQSISAARCWPQIGHCQS
jgi:hypothetical protein